ncbi:MAG: phosphate acyltransferase PlsX [Alphaproteobacteria bacterium]|jgi:glycerol-3-phosphate acyltransferase PlsX|nr:phosphate acyltransferase PlsX [Alphaproteobacteria bacterium]
MKDNKIIIAIDAMGGDDAPFTIIEGISIALHKDKDKNLFFNIYGNKATVMPVIKKFKNLNGNYEFFHTDSVITNEDKPANALRNGRESSMRLAINSVKDGLSHAVVSAGNTGALMAMSKFVLTSIKGIDRPAIVTYIPTRKNPCVILDLGANSECSAEQLLQFAIMGDAFAKSLLDIKEPTIGLLNIGSESIKGNKIVQDTSELLLKHQHHLNYKGFAEGHDIFKGNFDVIVADGFTGNITLKVIEGTVSFIKYKILSTFRGNYLSYPWLALTLAFSFLRIKKTAKEVDPRLYNGAMLVGLDGISIKSHGGADKISFSNAIKVAKKLVVAKINDKIKYELQSLPDINSNSENHN